MRITFNKIVLTDLGTMSPAGLQFDHTRAIQRDEGPRWSQPQWRERNNRFSVLSFSTTKIHDSVGAAEAFLEDHNDFLPEVADLITENPKGNGTIRRQYKNAALISIKMLHKGLTTFQTYQFEVGIPEILK